MTDFVLDLDSNEHWDEDFSKCVKYATFLKQPLTLGMFEPIDDQGNILKEPEGWNWFSIDPCRCPTCKSKYDISALEAYKKAKDKVLFKGFYISRESEHFFTVEKGVIFIQVQKKSTKATVEKLLKHWSDIELTESAIKKFI